MLRGQKTSPLASAEFVAAVDEVGVALHVDFALCRSNPVSIFVISINSYQKLTLSEEPREHGGGGGSDVGNLTAK